MATKEFYGQYFPASMVYSWTGTFGIQDSGNKDGSPTPAEGSDSMLLEEVRERRRSRNDICYELMEEIRKQGSAKPTQLMYSANLSWKTLTELLSYLSDRGLVRWSKVGPRRTLSITEEGTRLLESMRQVHSVLIADGQGAPGTLA
jgi:predicted transcriptional regulator